MPAKSARAPKVTLYEMSYSHHAIKARKLLDHKGIAHERVEVPYHDKRDLLKATGQDYVPWLQWGDKGVPWYDLVRFVEREVPSPAAWPQGMEGPSRMLEQWAHDILEEMVWRYVLPEMPATFKNEHERWIFEELQIRKRGSLEAVKERQPKALVELKEHLAHVETSLAQRDFILGDQPSLADFATFGAIEPLYYVGKEIPKDLPKTRAWRARVAKV